MSDLKTLTRHYAERKEAARRLLSEGEAYGTVLLVMFVDEYGTDGLQWAPEVICECLEKDWAVRMTRGNRDRLLAAVTVQTTDLFFTNLDAFIHICNVLSGDELDPGVFDPADSLECAWGCTEALLLWPPTDEDAEPFSDEIRHYIAQVLREEGYVRPPDVLGIAIGADVTDAVSTTFADDPDMFQAVYSVQQSKTAEVEDVLRDNLAEMFEQLKTVPLQHGVTADLERRIAEMSAANGGNR